MNQPFSSGSRPGDAFVPDPNRGHAIDARMHGELADSLAHLADATAQAYPDLSTGLKQVVAAVRGGKLLRPQAFRSYFCLVQDLLEEDHAAAKARIDALQSAAPRAAEMTVTHFGDPQADQLCVDLIQDGMRLAPIPEPEAREFAALLKEGFALMKQGLPDLHAELTGIVHEVLLARAPHGDKMEFDGASHYQFWGLLMLNPKHHKTPLAVVEVLAHEASHSLLFGMTIEEPLVFNPDDELFTSPLRIDPRPMDGIYHATYVSARMAWAMETLAASGALDAKDRDAALSMAAADRTNYAKGLTVIDADGRLSDTGARILNHARDWMAA